MTDVYNQYDKLPIMVQQQQQHQLFPGGPSVDVENWSRHVVPPTLYSPRPRTHSPPPPPPPPQQIGTNNNNNNNDVESNPDKNEYYRQQDGYWVALASIKPTDTLPPISGMLRRNRPKSSSSTNSGDKNNSRELPKLRTEFGPYHVDSSASLQELVGAKRNNTPHSAEILLKSPSTSIGRNDSMNRRFTEEQPRYHHHNNNNNHNHRPNRSESLHYGPRRVSHPLSNLHWTHTPTSPTTAGHSFPCRLDKPQTVLFPSPRLHSSASSAGSGHNHYQSAATYSPAASDGSIGVINASTSPSALRDERLQRYCNHLQLQKSRSITNTSPSHQSIPRRPSATSIATFDSVIHKGKDDDDDDDIAASAAAPKCRPCASRESSSTVMINPTTSSIRSSPRISVARVFSNHSASNTSNNNNSERRQQQQQASSSSSPQHQSTMHHPNYRFPRHSTKKKSDKKKNINSRQHETNTTTTTTTTTTTDNNNKTSQRAKLQPGCVIC